MRRTKLFTFPLLFLALIAVVCVGDRSQVSAAEQEKMGVCKDSPIPDIDRFLPQRCAVPDGAIEIKVFIPGVKEGKYSPVEVRSEQVSATEAQFCYYQEEKSCYYVEGLTDYIIILYNFLVGAIGIVSVGMIMFAAYKWIMAQGNSSKIQDAKDTLIGAIAGLAIALLSYVLLAAVNPQLVSLTSPVLPDVPPIPTVTPEAAVGCPSDSELFPLPFESPVLVQGKVSDPRMRQEGIDKLVKLKEIARDPQTYGIDASPMHIQITSAHRTMEKQQELYDDYKAGRGPEAAVPSCNAPHIAGVAVDACTGATCNWFGAANRKLSSAPADVKELAKDLQEVFAKAGWSRYCGEWWHFESSPRSCACAPGVFSGCSNPQ